jgi:hypothetical protein
MNIVDAVLCADVIEDARLEGGLVKIRAKLNKTYGRIDKAGFTGTDSAYYEVLENAPEYDEAFYERLEKGELDESELSAYGVELGDEGLPGIPVMG